MGNAGLQKMDITTLKGVLADLRDELIPSRFEKALQPEPSTLHIGFRTLKGLLWIELSWNADSARLVQISSPSNIGSESTLAKQIQHGLKKILVNT